MPGRPFIGRFPAPKPPWHESWARRAGKLALGGLAVLAVGRALLYLIYLGSRFGTLLEVYMLEAKMVHLAWRVQHGLSLYPAWREGPHVANFFGPVYFVLVGLLGRASGADLDGLFPIARGVTVGATLATTLLIGLYAGRRFGAGAGVLAAIVSLGSAPMIGFGVMARPDALADFLGFAGFLLAVSRSRRGVFAGSLLLLLAIFTKQTAVVYLLAACLANLWNARRAAALRIGGSVVLAALSITAIGTLVWEPRFASDLMGEFWSPRDLTACRALLRRFVLNSPDLLMGALIGLILWGLQPTRDLSLWTLTIVLLTTSLAASLKKGADLNYFLGLRSIEALAIAALWSAFKDAKGLRVVWLSVPATATALGLLISVVDIVPQAEFASHQRAFMSGRIGRAKLRQHKDLVQLCRDPAARVLTDDGLLDIQQGARTAFGDPWLFRLLASTGRLDPSDLKRAVEEERYDWILTTKALGDADYQDYDFGLPMPIVEAARKHYVLDGWRAGNFLYRPHKQRKAMGLESPNDGRS